jgi:hypothetical protein
VTLDELHHGQSGSAARALKLAGRFVERGDDGADVVLKTHRRRQFAVDDEGKANDIRVLMLHRPRPNRRSTATARATARQRRFRRRQRDGTMPIQIEIDAAIVTMLLETRWLAQSDSADRAKIAAAIMRMLADAAAPR